MNPRLKRRLRRGFAVVVVLGLLTVVLSNRWVINSTDAYLYKDSSLLPDNEVGLVLGTSTYTSEGKSNPQFYGRVQAAADLYKLGKVKRLIASGTNPDSRYNEPKRMREALLELGVPSEAIIMDFAGDRTFDSVARAKAVYGLDRVTLITQRYHGYRALFLARKMGLRAVGYVARLPDGSLGSRNPMREIFARTLAVFDLFLLGTEPRSSDPVPASQ